MERECIMQINSVGMGFGATIVNTHALNELKTVIKNSAKHDEFILPHKSYDDLCSQINEILPKKSDKVIFEICDNGGDEKRYSVGGKIVHNKKQKPFYTIVSPKIGSNIITENIVSSIKNSLNKII